MTKRKLTAEAELCDWIAQRAERAEAALRKLLPLVGHNELSHSTDAESRLCSRCAAVREAKAALAPTGDRRGIVSRDAEAGASPANPSSVTGAGVWRRDEAVRQWRLLMANGYHMEDELDGPLRRGGAGGSVGPHRGPRRAGRSVRVERIPGRQLGITGVVADP